MRTAPYRIGIIACIAIAIILCISQTAFAQTGTGWVQCDPSQVGSCDLCALLRTIHFVLYKIFELAFVGLIILVIIAGVKMFFSKGDTGKFKEALKGIQTGVIGIVIMLSAWIIVSTFIRFFAREDSPIQFWNQIECTPAVGCTSNGTHYNDGAIRCEDWEQFTCTGNTWKSSGRCTWCNQEGYSECDGTMRYTCRNGTWTPDLCPNDQYCEKGSCVVPPPNPSGCTVGTTKCDSTGPGCPAAKDYTCVYDKVTGAGVWVGGACCENGCGDNACKK